MSLIDRRIFTIKCDACGAEHHDPTSESALEARVAAGKAGWRFRQGKPGRHGKGSVQQLDACAGCDLQPRPSIRVEVAEEIATALLELAHEQFADGEYVSTDRAAAIAREIGSRDTPNATGV